MKLCRSLVAVASLLIAFTTAHTLAQGMASSQTIGPTVLVAKLSAPAYPTMAKVAQITGDVNVRLAIRRDGTIASAEVVDGHPLLKNAALDSATKSTFECRDCKEEVTSYTLTYSFKIRDIGPEAACGFKRLHSVKCLYLWKCGPYRQDNNPLAPEVTEAGRHITIRVYPSCIQASMAASANQTGSNERVPAADLPPSL